MVKCIIGYIVCKTQNKIAEQQSPSKLVRGGQRICAGVWGFYLWVLDVFFSLKSNACKAFILGKPMFYESNESMSHESMCQQVGSALFH